ncbi:MAG: hypothetical protein HUU46_21055 [Candidatus Hydrogenedentes bacterium]|nr:hypothetical protein [Candidatus Hydrogenedentota bacterium]
MSFSPGKRIEFEREVLARGAPLAHRATPRPRGRVLQITAVITLLAGAAAVGGAVAARAGFFNVEGRAIARMSKTFVNGLAGPDGAGALEACAEGVEGAKLIAAEERSVFGGEVPHAPGDAEQQLAALRMLRTELETQGVAWSAVTPFAFGGVRARVESASMKQPLTVLTGEIYFKSSGKTFAVEVSAWRCDGRFVIVDVWKAFPMSDSVTDLAGFSAEQAAKLQQQSAEAGSLSVSYLKQIYVTF